MDKILVFDDRLQVRVSLKDKFERQGIEVCTCKSVDEAFDIWDKEHTEIDAIVLDLMIPSYGISPMHRNATNMGQLTGWIWLWHELNPNNEEKHPAADKFIVIYSAYLSTLEAYINSKPENTAEKQFFASAKQFPKGDNKKESEVVELIVKELNAKKFSNSTFC